MLQNYNIKNVCLLLVFTCFYVNVYAQQHIYPPEVPLWNADSLGNQRAVLKVLKNTDQVTVAIDWRNRNVKENQQVYVVDSTINSIIDNFDLLKMTSEQGIIQFKPSSGPGIYYVYYLPFSRGGRSNNYPDSKYKITDKNQNFTNLKFKLSSSEIAKVLRLEPVNAFNSNDPMEIIATQKEVVVFKEKHKNSEVIIFPEKRDFPIKMTKHLPKKWIDQDSGSVFTDAAKQGENFTFQIGVWPIAKDLENVKATFSDLSDGSGNFIKKEEFTCFNTSGIDYTGKTFDKIVNIGQGIVQSLWCGIQVPKKTPAGKYNGIVTITANNTKPNTVNLILTIEDQEAADNGISEPWKQTRLNWINSTLAQENTVIAPYVPLKISGNTIALLGRSVTLGPNGLPEQIQSFFTEAMTSISTEPKNVLASPFEFRISDAKGQPMVLKSSGTSFIETKPGMVTWQANNTSTAVSMDIKGTLEFDGFANIEVKLIANEDVTLKDIALDAALYQNASNYILGLGQKGGKTPKSINWKWDVAHKNQDGFWLGDVNAGFQLTLRDENYNRPLNTNFYLQKPLVLPSSWGNGEKGGIDISKTDNLVKINNYSGSRTMKKGDTLYYNFTLLITPFHTLQTERQWSERYFHAYKPVDSVIQSGSNVINIHHANPLNPYINYPFIATKEMKDYVDEAHNAGLKVKIYNTVREVSNRVYELYPLRSLGHEVFSAGNGGGYSWLQEHLQDDYIAAWFVPEYKDAAIINSGMNRWHNYYVEGMNWLVKNIGIDGIYLDDVAFDRVTMKRVKRVLTEDGHSGLIDLHSANQYNERDGFNNSAFLYMEHFPYINRLWFGEYFDYEKESPDFYLTEVSGIPFGLMGEMLQDGGNPWRGMVYGMTNRMPYQKQKPDAIWKLWDDFGIKGSEMIGYWVKDSPVKTNNEKILATVYKKDVKVLVSIGSWANDDTTIKLNIDWKKLGMDPKKVKITAPEIRDFQPAAVFNPEDEIPVEMNKGWLLIIE